MVHLSIFSIRVWNKFTKICSHFDLSDKSFVNCYGTFYLIDQFLQLAVAKTCFSKAQDGSESLSKAKKSIVILENDDEKKMYLSLKTNYEFLEKNLFFGTIGK